MNGRVCIVVPNVNAIIVRMKNNKMHGKAVAFTAEGAKVEMTYNEGTPYGLVVNTDIFGNKR